VTEVSSARYTALAVLFSFLWASAFAAVKIGLRDAPPLFLMSSRFVVAGALLLAFAALRGRRLPALGEWPLIVGLGVLNYSLYLGLTALALRYVSAGLGAVLASLNPLLLALVAPWALGERLTPTKIVGLSTSFVSIVWVMRSRLGDDNRPEGVALLAGAIVCLVAATLVFKRARFQHDLLVLNGGQLLAAGIVLGLPSLVWEPVADVRVTFTFLVAWLYLLAGVSWLGMGVWFWLLRHGDATRASSYFFLNPIFGLFLGALLLGEPLGAVDFAGFAAVALGIYLVQLPRRGAAPRFRRAERA
jgi:drug/metabolite transporter (DMT)-like permease